MATLVLLRLAALTGEARYRDAAERALRTVTAFVARYPTGFAQWLSAMDLALAPVVELAIVGDPADAATRALHRRDDARLPPEPGRRGAARIRARPSSRCWPTGSRSTAADRVRLPRVRLPPAGHDPEALRAELAAAAASRRCAGHRAARATAA